MPNAIYYKQVEQTLDQSEQKKVVTLFRVCLHMLVLSFHLYVLFTVVLTNLFKTLFHQCRIRRPLSSSLHRGVALVCLLEGKKKLKPTFNTTQELEHAELYVQHTYVYNYYAYA